MTKVLVTGGCGFIGSAFVNLFKDKYEIHVLDKLTYAADVNRIDIPVSHLHVIDIREYAKVLQLMESIKPDVVVHFAAESHVDRSIADDSIFFETNVLGTRNLLEAGLRIDLQRFVHVSTDEVYGSVSVGSFFEGSALNPRNPYSASKAGAEHIVNAYGITHKMSCVITRGSNTYGPRQNSEKFVPTILKAIKNGEKIPLYGSGKQIRDWMFVEDHAAAVEHVMLSGHKGQVYNVCAGEEKSNKELIELIFDRVKRMHDNKYNVSEETIKHVEDRKGHDYRYSMSNTKLVNLGWTPRVKLQDGLDLLIYREL